MYIYINFNLTNKLTVSFPIDFTKNSYFNFYPMMFKNKKFFLNDNIMYKVINYLKI